MIRPEIADWMIMDLISNFIPPFGAITLSLPAVLDATRAIAGDRIRGWSVRHAGSGPHGAGANTRTTRSAGGQCSRLRST